MPAKKKSQPRKDTRLPFYVSAYDDNSEVYWFDVILARSRAEAFKTATDKIVKQFGDDKLWALDVDPPHSMSDADIMLQQKAEWAAKKLEVDAAEIRRHSGRKISEAALDAGALWVWSLFVEDQAITIISPLADSDDARVWACQRIAEEFANMKLSPHQMRRAIEDVLDYDPISLPLKEADALVLINPL